MHVVLDLGENRRTKSTGKKKEGIRNIRKRKQRERERERERESGLMRSLGFVGAAADARPPETSS